LVGAAAGGGVGVCLGAAASYFQQHERFGYDPPVDSPHSALLQSSDRAIYNSEGTIFSTNGATKVATVPFPPSL
jgi:hypothetical protein